MQLKVKKLEPGATLPFYAKPGDAGLDLYSLETRTLEPHECHPFKTGLALEIPPGHVGLVWDRSGNAFRKGLTILGGVIDSGYRGEILMITLNTSREPVEIKKGDRIAQLLIQPVIQAEIIEVDELSDSHRGIDGFGSTGI